MNADILLTKAKSQLTSKYPYFGMLASRLKHEESENIEFEDYLTTSAIAILFPYLRSVIADVTARSNEFPVLNLPVANISKMLVEQDAINYIRVSKK